MPGDTKPHKARQEKKRKKLRRLRKAGTLDDARLTLWRAIKAAEAIMYREGQDEDRILKCVHALNQAASGYAKLLEVGELEARIEEVEAAMKARAASPRPHYTGATA